MPYRDMLDPLVQRLVGLVGAEAALGLMRGIPGLQLDRQGAVIDYNRNNPQETAAMLIELYRAAGGQPGPAAARQAGPTNGQSEPAAAAGAPDDVATGPPRPARVMLVDDHALVRDGLNSLIDPQLDLEVVGQAGSMREAIALAHQLRPDVILMDFTLPDGTGDEATRVILSALPDTKIIFLTVHDDDERLFAAIAAGATGYLLKSIRSADLLDRLRAVIRGDVALSPPIGQRILERFARQALEPKPAPKEELTERETATLRLIVQGYTNRQIADALRLSVRTVEYHRANIMSKLNLHSRADLVRYAAEHNLLGAKEHQ